jgi:hypothetical protein
MKKAVFLFLCISLSSYLFSQVTDTKSDTLRKDALKVFMESTDYIRKEIPYVNYVRDIKDADVYIISTDQKTGSGGTEYSYFFVGQHDYSGKSDTLEFVASPDETLEGIRKREVSILKMGLMRYVSKTPLAKYMNISFTEPMSETISSDKWDSWVFKSSIYGYLQGEKSNKANYLSGSVSANRITEDWKINLSSSLSENKSRYIINDSTEIHGENSSKSIRALAVRSLTDHWSVGGTIRMGSSSYSNEHYYASLMPGIEYDLFPYSESTRRQLRILYTPGFIFENYNDTTIYNKMKEVLWNHSLTASYAVVQKWGNINLTAGYSNYLHDWSKYNLSVTGYLELRIAKGLSITLVASASAVHDQISLLKKNIPVDQILLGKIELPSKYQYFTSFGFTYTFGSIYNNVVNPRFGNTGGGGISISISE